MTLWDVASGKLETTLTDHQGGVHFAAFSPDGTTLATGSEDKTLRLWKLPAGMTSSKAAGSDQAPERLFDCFDDGRHGSSPWIAFYERSKTTALGAMPTAPRGHALGSRQNVGSTIRPGNVR